MPANLTEMKTMDLEESDKAHENWLNSPAINQCYPETVAMVARDRLAIRAELERRHATAQDIRTVREALLDGTAEWLRSDNH